MNDLPDDVLCHMLSFLQSKDSVATSILSRRWRHLWTSITSLDFDDQSFCFRRNTKSSSSFSMFVDTTLMNHKNLSGLTSFRLSCCQSLSDSSQLHRWIRSVSGPQLEEFVIWIKPTSQILPQLDLADIRLSKRLRVLKLRNCILLRANTDLQSLSFPTLKTLELSNVYIADVHQFNSLLEESLIGPEIEELSVHLQASRLVDLGQNLFTKAKNLRALKLCNGIRICSIPTTFLRPKLKVLELAGVTVRESSESQFRAWIQAVISPEIETLHICLEGIHSTIQVGEKEDTLFALKALRVLKLGSSNEHSFNGLEIYSSCLPSLVTLELYQFHRMTSDGDLITRLVSNSPVLETLVIKESDFSTLHIESLSLKHLRVVGCSSPAGEDEWRITVKAPKLVAIELQDPMVAEYSIDCSAFLSSARISVGDRFADRKLVPRLVRLLDQISNAKQVQLCPVTVEWEQNVIVQKQLRKTTTGEIPQVKVNVAYPPSLSLSSLCSPPFPLSIKFPEAVKLRPSNRQQMGPSFIWVYVLLLLHLFIFVWQISRKPRSVDSSAAAESTLSPSSDSGETEASAPSIHKYDVFLSFRGADTRGNFTSHLYAALRGHRILSYIDDVNLRRGQDITDSLLKAIEHSKVAVVVLSENYASSGWCLDELVKILHCRNRFNQVVLPVFYGSVQSSHVQNQTGSYAVAFAKHRMSPPEKVKIWKAALKEVAGIPGCDSLQFRTEAELVKNVVESVLTTLNDDPSTAQFNGLVGIQTRVEEIESLLHMESVSGTRIIGMWGMGGMGKTTLARAVFDQFSSRFEACHFLGNVREELERGSTELGLQGELFSCILEDDDDLATKHSTNLALTFAKSRLARTRVLVVLDDVEDPLALDNLLDKQPHTLFGPGSRILVTSRDRQVLQNVCDEIFEVKQLNNHESFQLFTSNAFGNDDPSEEYLEQSWRAISYASGNPLALIVLAKALFGRSIEYWESALRRLQRVPNRKVENILMISYDGLDRDERNAFLDIACFYRGESRDRVKSMLDGCYGDGSSENIITSLADRALVDMISGGDGSTVMMHDLLKEMGRGIVKEESDDPGKRSRLWDQNDVYALLARRAGTSRIKGISVELAEIGEMQLHSDAFAGMTRLRVLRFHLPNGGNCNYQAIKLPEDGLQFLSNQLMSFHWHQFPSRTLPPSFSAEKLIDLSLPYSDIQHLWTGVQNLASLKYISLSYCTKLVQLPDLSMAKKIEEIHLIGCESLVEIPSYIQDMENLTDFNTWNCRSLPELPHRFKSKSVKNISLSAENCPALTNYKQVHFGQQHEDDWIHDEPQNAAAVPVRVLHFHNSLNLRDLRLGGSDIQELPSSVELLTNVVNLDMSKSRHLRYVSPNICKLNNLESLDFTGCVALEAFPEILEPMERLSRLFLGGTSIREMPSSSIYNLVNLQWLGLNNCRKLICLPEVIQLSYKLTGLDIRDCWSLGCLPQLPQSLDTLNADDCFSLCSLPDSIYLYNLGCSRFANCFQLNQDALIRWMLDSFKIQRIAADMYFPGSEVPDCFQYASIGSEITIRLASSRTREVEYGSKGIAYCLVVEQDNGPYTYRPEDDDADSTEKYRAPMSPLECHWKISSPWSSSTEAGRWCHNASTRGYPQFKTDHLVILYRGWEHERRMFDRRNAGREISLGFQFTFGLKNDIDQ
ncbi:Disease resistance-like protein DSC1 [Linum grandiflorum]